MLPETDAGVLAQVVLFVIALSVWGWAVRSKPEWRLIVVGVGLVGFGLIGVRSLH